MPEQKKFNVYFVAKGYFAVETENSQEAKKYVTDIVKMNPNDFQFLPRPIITEVTVIDTVESTTQK